MVAEDEEVLLMINEVVIIVAVIIIILTENYLINQHYECFVVIMTMKWKKFVYPMKK